MPREYPELPVVAVGVAVVKDDRVLIIKRGAEPAYGRWSLPGGVVELGESVREAARREVLEECGIDVEVGQVVEVVERVLMDTDHRIQYHYVILDFLGKWRGRELQPASDVLEARLVSPDELDKYDMTVGAAEVCRKAIELQRFALASSDPAQS